MSQAEFFSCLLYNKSKHRIVRLRKVCVSMLVLANQTGINRFEVPSMLLSCQHSPAVLQSWYRKTNPWRIVGMISLTWTSLSLSLKSCCGEPHDHEKGPSKLHWQLPHISVHLYCILVYDSQVRRNHPVRRRVFWEYIYSTCSLLFMYLLRTPFRLEQTKIYPS